MIVFPHDDITMEGNDLVHGQRAIQHLRLLYNQEFYVHPFLTLILVAILLIMAVEILLNGIMFSRAQLHLRTHFGTLPSQLNYRCNPGG
jgi:hypothetical protein